MSYIHNKCPEEESCVDIITFYWFFLWRMHNSVESYLDRYRLYHSIPQHGSKMSNLNTFGAQFSDFWLYVGKIDENASLHISFF